MQRSSRNPGLLLHRCVTAGLASQVERQSSRRTVGNGNNMIRAAGTTMVQPGPIQKMSTSGKREARDHSPLFSRCSNLCKCWIDKYNIILIPTYFPGDRNVMAHALSRLTQFVPCLTDSSRRHVWHSPEEGHTRLCVTSTRQESLSGRRPISIMRKFRLIYTFPLAPIVPKTFDKIQQPQGTTVIFKASSKSIQTMSPSPFT